MTAAAIDDVVYGESGQPADRRVRWHQDDTYCSSAVYSPDLAYRYWLVRFFKGVPDDRGLVNFICLNPSTATEAVNDPTVERLCRRARRWGYAGLVVTNIFAYRATDPADMKRQLDPVGVLNNDYITRAATPQNWDVRRVVAAWGAHGVYRGRGAEVEALLRRLGRPVYCLGRTNGGQPRHPLYLSFSVEPEIL